MKDHLRLRSDPHGLLAFRTHAHEPAAPPPLCLRGLNPAARYTLEGFPGVRSGLAWMNTGLQVWLGNLQITVRRIRRVE